MDCADARTGGPGMSRLLQGRTALILGLDDVGSGIARRFTREGARVAVADIDDPSRTDALNLAIGYMAIPAKPGDDGHEIRDIVTNAVAELGGLDVLVCNLLPEARARTTTFTLKSGIENMLKSMLNDDAITVEAVNA